MEKKANGMKNTIISSVVAIVCVAALCITYAVTGKNTTAAETQNAATQNPAAVTAAAESDDYMTESEAAAYIGVTLDVMQLMREKLGYFKGAYMYYIYNDADGNEVKSVVYNKEALNEAMDEICEKNSALSFKTLQENK